MLKITNLRYKLIITLIISLYAFILYISPLSCIILKLTGIRCPGCGMTRAIISALSFNFRDAFSHHFMFWSLPILYLCFLFDGKLFKNRTANLFLYIIIFGGFITNWLIHIIPWQIMTKFYWQIIMELL